MRSLAHASFVPQTIPAYSHDTEPFAARHSRRGREERRREFRAVVALGSPRTATGQREDHPRDRSVSQRVPPREIPLQHSVRAPYGDFWSVTVPIAGTAAAVPGSAWGTPGRYVYRYRSHNPKVGMLDWIIDPCAREFGVGKLSAFTLGYQPTVERGRKRKLADPGASRLDPL